MSARGKTWLAVLGGLLAALILLVVIFDWNWLRRPVEALVEDQLGRDIRIAGDLDAEFSLTPRIIAHDVRLANAEWGSEPDMLQVDRLSFVLDVPTLIGGRLDVSDIAIEGADVLVERSVDGELNWQLEEEEEETLAPIVGEFEVENATVRYRDPALERELLVALTSAQGTGGRATEPLQAQGEGEFAGLPLEVALEAGSLNRLQEGDEPYPIDVRLAADDNVLRLAGTVTTPQEVQTAELSLDIEGPELTPLLAALEITEEPAPPISASARLVHEREVWALLDLDLEVGGSVLTGDLGFDMGEDPTLVRARLDSDGLALEELIHFLETVLPTEPAVEGPPLFTEEGLDPDALPKLRADIELDARDVAVTPELVLDRLRLDAKLADQIPRLAVVGDGQHRGDPVALDVALGGEPTPDRAYPVRGTIEVGQGSLELTGRTARPLDLTALEVEVDLRSPDPSGLLELLRLPAPNLPEMELAGRLARDEGRVELTDFSARVGESDLSGTLRAALGEPRPRIEADLASSYLDYSDVAPLVDAFEQLTEADLDTGPGLITVEDGRPRLQPEALPEVDAELAFRAERLEAPEVRLQDVEAQLRLGEHLPVLTLVAQGTVFGEQTDIDLALGTTDAVEAPPEAYPIEARVTAEQTRLELSGWLERPVELEGISLGFELTSPAPARWLELVDLPAPELPPIEASGRLIQDGETWQLADASLASGESDIAGVLAVSLADPRPAIEADLVSDYLHYNDVEPFVEVIQGLMPNRAGPEFFTMVGARPQIRPEALPDVDADLTYRAERLEGPEVSLQNVRAKLQLQEELPALTLVAEGAVLGEQTEIDLALGAIEDQPDAYPVEARITAEQTRLELSGTIERPEEFEGVDLQFEIASPDPTRWLALVGLPAPELPTIRASGRVLQEEQSWRFPDLYLEVAENNLFGEAALDLDRARPFIRADLQSNRLVVEELWQLVSDEADGEAEDEAAPDGLMQNGVALPGVDLDLALEAEHLSWQDMRLEPLTARLHAREQVLVLDASGEGWFHDSPITVQAQLGSEEVLEDPAAPYPVQLALVTRDTEVRAQGSVGEPLEFTDLDVELSLAGADLQVLGELLQLGLPSTPPYQLTSMVQHENAVWTLTGLDGRIGDSDLGGEIMLDASGEPPRVSADLRSERLDFADLGAVVGEPEDPEATVEEEPGVLPEEEVEIADLPGIDLELRYAARNVVARQIPVDQVEVEARLEDGLLRIAPLAFELGVGVFTGELSLDTRADPAQASADLRLRGADAEYIFDLLEVELPEAEAPLAVGRLDGRAQLAAQGASVDQMVDNLDGQVVGIVEGGWVTAVLVQQLGMNLLEILGFFAPDPEEMEPVRCFVASFDLTGGVMEVEALVLDTEETVITGAGAVDWAGERIDLAIQAHPKELEFPVLAPTPVEITGPFGEVEVGPDLGEVAQTFLVALGLGVVLPVVGAAIPFIEPGLAEDSDCAWLMDQAAQAGAPEGAAAPELN